MSGRRQHPAAARIDTSRAHPARVYNYLLGGKDNFAADREAARALLRLLPSARTMARENRAFMSRAVRYLVAGAGVRQFLDIGTGLPSVDNVHEVAQGIAPQCRVLYVDNDPIVLAHARALLASSPEGRTAYLEADLREPEKILSDPVTREMLDFTQPIALLMVAILHFLPDEEEPARLVRTLVDALPPGSYLAASHGASDHMSGQTVAEGARAYGEHGVTSVGRSADEFAGLAFSGLEMVEPGLVLVSDWHPDHTGPHPLAREVSLYAGVGRKP